MRALSIALLLFTHNALCEPSPSPSDIPPLAPHQDAPANQGPGDPLQDIPPPHGADGTPANVPSATGSVLSGVTQPAAAAAGTAAVALLSGAQPPSGAAPGAAPAVTPGECGPDSPADVLLLEADTCRADESLPLGTAQTGSDASASGDSGAPADAAQQEVNLISPVTRVLCSSSDMLTSSDVHG